MSLILWWYELMLKNLKRFRAEQRVHQGCILSHILNLFIIGKSNCSEIDFEITFASCKIKQIPTLAQAIVNVILKVFSSCNMNDFFLV